MGDWSSLGRRWRWCSLVASVAFLTAIRDVKAEICGGSNSDTDRFLMLVSTLDGRLTALEVGTGVESWSVTAGATPLLSSSITNLEIARDGASVRLIPSLDGGLYQYDGTAIEPVPLAADVLLSNSFRFSDDSTVVGGKEVENYGVDVNTGQLKYVCSTDGCETFNTNSSEEEDDNSGDVLVITRHTKTIRAVEMLRGNEKWNFSVGQHELEYVKSSRKNVPPGGRYRTSRDHLVTGGDEQQHCSVDTEEEGFFDGFNFHWFSEEEAGNSYSVDDLHLKVIVPSGLVVAVLKSNPSQVVWQQQFGVAIANAWLLRGEQLQEVNLFDNQNVPALSVEHADTIPDGEHSDDSPKAVLYVGVYNNQVYVQPSDSLQQEVHAATTRAVVTGDISTIHMPRVHWKPYLATAESRTPIMTRELRRAIDYDKETVIEDADTAIVPRQLGYPFDDGAEDGIYLLQDYTPVGEALQIEDKSQHKVMSDSSMLGLVTWWRELFAVTMLTVCVSVMVHLVMMRASVKEKPTEKEEIQTSKESGRTKRDSSSQSESSMSMDQQYTSRYYTDFEQMTVLGHGGFGVVFQSKNQLDDCVYAIKRIALNNSDRAKEKVMREVKALAKLDHTGIVRYHQSWFESPPPGWQEHRDKACIEMPAAILGYTETGLSPTPSEVAPTPTAPTQLSPTSPTSPFDQNNPIRRLSQLYLSQMDNNLHIPYPKLDNYNPLKPCSEEGFMSSLRMEVVDESWDASSGVTGGGVVVQCTGGDGDNNESNLKAGSSGVFVPLVSKFSFGDSDSDSDSEEGEDHYSKDIDDGAKPNYNMMSDDSFGISFRDDRVSDGGAINPPATDIPFQAYTIDSSNTESKDLANDSFSIVFAGSSCDMGSDGSSVKCQNSPHSVINISNTGSQSKPSVRDHRSLSSPLPHQVPTVSSNHRKTPSCDLTSHTRRPGHLPLISTQCQTMAVQDAKLYLYIQMQLCKRESLREWLAANKTNRDRLLLLDIFHQIVTAMDYVHETGLMHRDLKPSNIFFSMDGIVKIGDFGLVTAQEENVLTPYDSPSEHQSIHTGQVGTRLYMSPEQHAGKHYTHKIDIYALGLIFFELVYPFDTQMERIHIMSDVKRLRFPDRFVKMMSKDEVLFVKHMLSHDPEQRPSCKDILRQPMFATFETIHQAYLNARARSSSRIRTYSTSSNNSGSGSGSSPSVDGLAGPPIFY